MAREGVDRLDERRSRRADRLVLRSGWFSNSAPSLKSWAIQPAKLPSFALSAGEVCQIACDCDVPEEVRAQSMREVYALCSGTIARRLANLDSIKGKGEQRGRLRRFNYPTFGE